MRTEMDSLIEDKELLGKILEDSRDTTHTKDEDVMNYAEEIDDHNVLEDDEEEEEEDDVDLHIEEMEANTTDVIHSRIKRTENSELDAEQQETTTKKNTREKKDRQRSKNRNKDKKNKKKRGFKSEAVHIVPYIENLEEKMESIHKGGGKL